MILVGLGSNVSGPWGNPVETVTEALRRLDEPPLRLVAASALRETEPVGVTNQPVFVNAVCMIETELDDYSLLEHLLDLELEADRRRTVRWGPRTLDLDLLDYHGAVVDKIGETGHARCLRLPHPEIENRRFVLEPLAEIAPGWRHPVNGKTAAEMLRAFTEK